MSPSRHTVTINSASIPTQNETAPSVHDALPTPTFGSDSDADTATDAREVSPERINNTGTAGKSTTPNHHGDREIRRSCVSSDNVLGGERGPTDQAQNQDNRGNP